MTPVRAAAEATCSATVAPPCAFQSFGTSPTVTQGFEIDGNTSVDDTSKPNFDWASVAGSPGYTAFSDPLNSPSDNIMSNGAKESDQTTWSCTTGNVEGKSDIGTGAVYFAKATSGTRAGDQFVFGDFTRAATTGDVHLDYEFNRASQNLTGSCSALPLRSSGDVLIGFDAANGGATIAVSAFTWSCPTNAGSNACTGAGTWVASSNFIQGDTFDGATNMAPNFSDSGQLPGSYGEAGLDLTATVGTFACNEFGKAYMKSRSAGTSDIANGNAAVKDYVSPITLNLSSCPTSGLKKSVRDASVSGSTFAASTTANPGDTIQYQLEYTNTGSAAASNVVVTDAIPARSTYAAGSCSNSCIAASAATFNSSSPCASTNAAAGQTVTELVWCLGSEP
ncbi:MAG TPA: DUF11 domain-containing protein, partial [Candidatus Dormibacteraeota bacterium]|nr:DUF11 domain-containing protein [Candidatus Dormibacteraeota bacterium]